MSLRKQLTDPYQVSFTVYQLHVDSIAVDNDSQLIHLGHSLLDDNGNDIQSDRPETLQGQDYLDFNVRKNDLGSSLSAVDAIQQTALEYLPGEGTITDNIKTLTIPYAVNGLCNMLAIESFAFNTDDKLVHIGYTKLTYPDDVIISFLPWTLSGPEFDLFMARLNENELTMSVTAAEITTCLEFLPGDGTVVDV